MSARSIPPSLLVFCASFATIFSLGALAIAAGQPWLFPSLGPTAFMLFFTPQAAASSPRNTLCGHAIGIICGWASLWLTGLQDAGPAIALAMGYDRVLAAALALAATGGLMISLRAVHPPAGATTLIIALGFITRPVDLLVIELAIALLIVQAWMINRAAGIDYPIWAPRNDTP